ncbi:hypothetical protein JXA32_05490 [Candidatus Sumerlaeota bacterium]|nr:hypothetical protein [Candidatus Sumerlaeota bacterium]
MERPVDKRTSDLTAWTAELRSKALERHGWLFAETFKVKFVWIFIPCFAGIVTLLAIGMLWTVNPRLFWFTNGRWNSIDSIADPRPGKDYVERQPFTTLAESGDWLALGTASHGLLAIHKRSRVPRELMNDKGALDVCARADGDGFLALLHDQSIQTIKMPSGMQFSPREEQWLDGENAGWMVAEGTSEDAKILASGLDQRGMLLAVKGWGVGRYLLRADGSDSCRRQRQWEFGDYQQCNLDQAAMSSNSLWICRSVSGGAQLIGIRRADLREFARYNLDDAQVTDLDADWTDAWAAVTDSRGGKWLTSPQAKSISGPFFSLYREDPSIPPLDDQNIAAARLADSAIWISTGQGGYGYHIPSHSMSCIFGGGADQIAVARSPSSGDSVALFPTSHGLKTCRMDKNGRASVAEIDPNAIEEIGVSEYDGAVVYTRQTLMENNEKRREVCYVRSVLADHPRPAVINAGTQWERSASSPNALQIKGIQKAESNRLIVATTQGAFRYDQSRHDYQDISRSLFFVRNGDSYELKEGTLSAFESVVSSDGIIAALAQEELSAQTGWQPYLFMGEGGGANKWRCLDSFGLNDGRKPSSIAVAAGRVFGKDENGSLYRYPKETLRDQDCEAFFSGAFSCLIDRVEAKEESFIGDIYGRQGASRGIIFMGMSGMLCHYDLRNGEASELGIPQGHIIAELRGANSKGGRTLEVAARTMEGRVLLRNEILVEQTALAEWKLWGEGRLSFAPDSIKAIAKTESGHILVSDGAGLAEYDPRWGSWKQHSIPDYVSSNAITSILPAGGAINLCTASDYVYHSDENGAYRKWPEAVRVYPGSSGLWCVMQDGGISWFANSFATSDRRLCHATSDMKEFIESNALWLWQPETEAAGNFFFLPGRNGLCGIYDATLNNFSTVRLKISAALDRVQCSGEAIALAAGDDVMWGYAERAGLSLSSVRKLDGNRKAYDMLLQPDQLRIATISANGGIKVEDYQNVSQPSASGERRRGGIPAYGFNPVAVVGAIETEPLIHMIDDHGRVVKYSVAEGAWEIVSQPPADASLHGWIGARRGDDKVELELLFRQSSGDALSVNVSDQKRKITYRCDPAELAPYFKSLADAEEIKALAQEAEAKRLSDQFATSEKCRKELSQKQADLNAESKRISKQIADNNQKRNASLARQKSAKDKISQNEKYVTDNTAEIKSIKAQLNSEEAQGWSLGAYMQRRRLQKSLKEAQNRLDWFEQGIVQAQSGLQNLSQELEKLELEQPRLELENQRIAEELPGLAEELRLADDLIQKTESSIKLAKSLAEQARAEKLKYTQLAQHYEHVSTPKDDEAICSGKLWIYRANGQTNYRMRTQEDFIELHCQDGGFVEDAYDEALLLDDGRIIAQCASGRLVLAPNADRKTLDILQRTSLEFEPELQASSPAGLVVAASPQGSPRYLKRRLSDLTGTINGETQHVVADVAYGPLKLQCIAAAGGGLAFHWVDPANSGDVLPPVWSGQRLAVQAARDMHVSATGELIILTDAGVGIHDENTLQLQAWHPLRQGIRFFHAVYDSGGANDCIIETPDGFVCYENGVLSGNGQDQSISLVCRAGNDCRWLFDLQQCQLKQVYWNDERQVPVERKWEAEDTGYRFADDWVVSVAEGSNTAFICNTRHRGLAFHLDPSNGREGILTDGWRSQADPELYANAAWRAKEEGNFIRFTTSDDGGVFVKGKFFSDVGGQIVADGDEIVSLLPDRGLLTRDAREPMNTTRYAPFSESMPEGLLLGCDAKGVYLEAPEIDFRWRCLGDSATPLWSRDFEPEPASAAKLLTEWRRDKGQWQAWIRSISGDRTCLTRVWGKNRFLWDDVFDVEVLSTNNIVAATELGIIAIRLDGNSDAVEEGLIEDVDIGDLEEARNEEGLRCGVMVKNWRTPKNWALLTGNDERIVTAQKNVAAGKLRRSVVSLNKTRRNPTGNLEYCFEDSWPLKSSLSRFASLEIRMDGMPFDDFIVNGRFVFDNVDAVCSEPEVENTIIWHGCESEYSSVAGYQLFKYAADRSRPGELRLIDVRLLAKRYDYLRFDKDRLWGLSQSADKLGGRGIDDLTSVFPFDRKQLTADAIGAFRNGDCAIINESNLEWSVKQRFLDSQLPYVSISDGDWIRNGESLLFALPGSNVRMWAFDYFLSLSSNPDDESFALGTMCGVWEAPWSDSGLSVITHPKGRLLEVMAPDGKAGQWSNGFKSFGGDAESHAQILQTVFRVRFHEGDLWALCTPPQKSSFSPFPFLGMSLDPGEFQVSVDEIRFQSRSYPSSNDAWWIGRKPFVDLCDGVLDSDNPHILWLCSSSNGVFKVFIDKL